MKRKFVSVKWHDAASEDDWTLEDDIDPEGPTVHTVGHLVKSTKESIVVALSHDPAQSHYSNWLTIPRRMIISMAELEPKKLSKSEIRRLKANK